MVLNFSWLRLKLNTWLYSLFNIKTFATLKGFFHFLSFVYCVSGEWRPPCCLVTARAWWKREGGLKTKYETGRDATQCRDMCKHLSYRPWWVKNTINIIHGSTFCALAANNVSIESVNHSQTCCVAVVSWYLWILTLFNLRSLLINLRSEYSFCADGSWRAVLINVNNDITPIYNLATESQCLTHKTLYIFKK